MGVWEKYPEAEETLLKLLNEGKGYKEISLLLSDIFNDNFSYYAVVNKVRRMNGGNLTNTIIKKVGTENKYGIKKLPNRKIYLIISDLHIPFELPQINDIVLEFQGYADGIIIAGDFLDEYSVSRFTKEKEISLQEELVTGYGYLKLWTSIFPEVVIIKGNHDNRIDMFLRNNLKETLLFLIPDNFLLRHYITGFTIKDGLGNETYFEGLPNLKIINDFYYQVGDCIIAHPYDFWSIDGKTVIMTNEYFIRRNFDFNALIIGHTHKAIKITQGKEKLLMEIGCLCKEMDYTKAGKVKYKPHTNAFGVLVQEQGKTLFNETYYITL